MARLAAQGHTARVLTRNVDAARAKLPFPRTEFFAPPQWGAAVCGARGVVNLAGAPQLQGGCASESCASCSGNCVRYAQVQVNLAIAPQVALSRGCTGQSFFQHTFYIWICGILRDCSLTVRLLNSCAFCKGRMAVCGGGLITLVVMLSSGVKGHHTRAMHIGRFGHPRQIEMPMQANRLARGGRRP